MKLEDIFINLINENSQSKNKGKKFVIDKKNNKFQLFLDDVMVTESGFSIEKPDKWFDEKYGTIFNLKTVKKYREQGFAKYLLKQIFKHFKNDLKINVITLLVYKKNVKALNLYTKMGFEKFQTNNVKDSEKTSYILIKKL